MITSNGQRVFIDNKSSIICYNYNNYDEVWEKYGANYTSGATKDGKVVKTTENVKIGFNANKGGNRVVAHNMGTYHINIFEINLKTMVWEKIQTLENIEYSTSSSGSYVFDFKGDNLLIYVNDSNNKGNLHYYAFNNTTHSYDNKFTINNISGIANENTIRNVVTNKEGTIFAISDTNGNTYQSVNDNNNGTVKIYDVDSSYNYTLRSTLTSSNDSGLFGDSISLNLDGDRIVITEPIEGAIYPYSYDSNTTSWSLIGGSSLNFFDLSSSRYNNIVKINSIGDAFFISEFDNNDSENGVFYGYYQDNSDNWNKYEELSGNFYETIDNSSNNLLGSGFSFTNTSHFGSIMSLNSQGNRILIGSNNSTNDINGFVIKLKKDPNATTQSLTSLGVSANDIVKLELTPQELVGDSGLNTSELKNLGVGADTLLTGGTSESDLLDSGFGLGDIVSASNDLSSLVSDPSNNVTALDLLGSTSVSDLLTKGISVNDLLGDISSGDASSNATVDYSQFKDANVSATDLKDSGIDATTLKDAAYSPSDLVSAGFAVTDLKDAAIPATDLKSAGLGFSDLDGAFEPEDLLNANFDDNDFENAGYTVEPTKTLSVSLGAVTFSQEVKTVVKNENIDNFSTSLPDTENLKKFLADNPNATNVLSIGAQDSDGKDIFDVSSGPIVLTLDLPDLDTTEQFVLCKYDSSNNLMDPQPPGYPVTLTYNPEIQKFTGSLKSLSTVTPVTFASAPDAMEDEEQLFISTLGNIANGLPSIQHIYRIYFVTPVRNNIDYTGYSMDMFNIYYGDSSSNLTLVNTGTVTNYTDPNGNYKLILRNREGGGNTMRAYTDLLENVNNENLFPTLANPNSPKNRIRWNGRRFPILRAFNLFYFQLRILNKNLKPQYFKIENKSDAIKFKDRGYVNKVTSIEFSYDNLPLPEVLSIGPDDTSIFYTHTYTDAEGNEIVEYYTNKVEEVLINIITASGLSKKLTTYRIDNLKANNGAIGTFAIGDGFSHKIGLSGVVDQTSTSGTTAVSLIIPKGTLASTQNTLNEIESIFTFFIDVFPPTLEITSNIETNSSSNASSINMTFQTSKDIRDLQIQHFLIENAILTNLIISKNEDGTTNFSKYTGILIPSDENSVVQISIQLNRNTIQDLGGNYNSLASNKFIWNYDGVKPTINIISSDISSNDFYYNDFISLEFEVSEELLDFNINNHIQVTNGYLARFSKKTDSFNYTARLYPNDAVSSSSISVIVNSETVQDTFGNFNNFASNKFIWNYDVTKPKITITAFDDDYVNSIASGSNSEDAYINCKIYSSKPVDEITLDSFSVTNGSVIDLEVLDNTYQNYNVKLFPLSNILTASINAKAYQVRDITNNLNNVGSSKFYWRYSGDAPIVSIYSNDIDLNFESTDISINFIVKISDTDITLLDSYLDNSGGTISDFQQSFDEYIAVHTATNPYELNEIKMPGQTVSNTDNIGNNPSNIFKWTWNKIRPTITITSDDMVSSDINNLESITLKLTPSEDISDLTIDDFTLNNGYLTNFVKQENDNIYNVTLRPNEGSVLTTVTATVNENSFKDIYNYYNTAPSNTFIWNYDSIVPELTISSITMNSGETNNLSKINFTITSTKALKSVSLDNITVHNGSAQNIIKINDTVYTFDVIPDNFELLQIVIFIDYNKVQDLANNYNQISNYFIWNYDIIPPKVISITNNSGFINNVGTSINWFRTFVRRVPYFYYTFNKKISVINAGSFAITDIYHKNNEDFSVSLGPLVYEENYDRYKLKILPIISRVNDNWSFTLRLPANSVKDEIGNVNIEEAEPFKIINSRGRAEISLKAYDLSENEITNYSTTNDNEIYIDIQALASVHRTLYYLDKITVTNGILEINTDETNISGTIWKNGYNGIISRFKLIPSSSNTTTTIEIAEGLFRAPKSWRAVSYALDTSFNWTIDSEGPSLNMTPVQIIDGAQTRIQDISINFVFSETMNTVAQSDISLVNATFTSFDGSGSNYSATVTADSSIESDTIKVFLPDDHNITDIAGNKCNIYNSLSWTYNNVTPKISSIYSNDVSLNGYLSNTTTRIYMEFTMNVTVELQTFEKLLSNASITNIIYDDSYTDKTVYYIDIDNTNNNDNVNVKTVLLNITKDSFYATFDNAPLYNNESYTFSYEYYNSIPLLQLSSSVPSGTITNTDNIVLTMTEKNAIPLYDFTQDDITVTSSVGSGYSITNFSVDSSYSFSCTLNSTEDATIVFSINANKYKNIANQYNTENSQFTWTRNTTPVIISIYSTTLDSGSTSTDEELSLIIKTNKPVKKSDIIEYITITNANIDTLTSEDEDTTFTTKLIPKIKNIQSSIYIEADVIYDLYGNINTSASNTFYWTFSGINPTVDLTCENIPNGAISALSEISMNIDITSEENIDIGSSIVSITNGNISNFVEVSNNYYEFTFTPIERNIDCVIKVNDGAFTDSFGTANIASNSFSWIFNDSSPFVTITCDDDVNSGDNSNKEFFNIVFTFSTNIANFTSSDIELSGGSIGSLVKESNTKYTTIFTPSIESGVLSLNIPADVCEDATNGNLNAASLPEGGFFINYDIARPTIDISSSVVSGTSSNDNNVTVKFIGSEDIVNFDFNKILFTNSTLGGFKQLDLKTYRVFVRPVNNNTVSIQLPEGACTDLAGNINTSSSIFEWTYDSVAIFIVLTSETLTEGEINNTGNKYITFGVEVGDNSVDLTENDLSYTNVAIVPNTFDETDGEDENKKYYTFQVETLFSGEESSIFIPSNRIYDDANNGNTESNKFEWIYDSTSPTIKISSPDISSGDTTNDEEITLYFTPNKILNSASFTRSDITIVNGEIINNEITQVNDLLYSCVLRPTSSNTTVTVNIAKELIEDTKSTLNEEASNTFIWNCDTTKPYISLNLTEDTIRSYYAKQTVAAELYNNDTSTTITSSDISAINCTIENFTKITNTGSSNNDRYTFDITSTSPNNSVSVFIPENTIIDAAGNGNDETNKIEWIYDSSPLTITSISSTEVEKGGFTNKDIVNIIFTLSETVYNLQSSILITENCTIESFNGNSSGNQYTIQVSCNTPNTISIELDSSISITTGRYLSKQLTGDNLKFNWSFDNITPEMTITSSDQLDGVTNNKSYIDILFKSTKNIDSFTTSNIRLLGDATISNFDGSNNEYSARITPSSTSTIIANVDAGTFQDTVGNYNTLDSSFTWYYDATSPTIEISSNVVSGSSSDAQYVDISFIVSESVADFNINDINVTNGTIGSFDGSGQYYSARLKPKIANTATNVIVPIGVISDSAGNFNDTSSNEYNWTYTGNAVTLILSSSNISNNTSYKFSNINMRVNTNIEVTGFTLDDISYSNGTISDLSNIDSNNWEFTFTSDISNTESSVFIPADGILSVLNNSDLNLESNKFIWTYDNSKPTVQITSTTINSGDYTNTSPIFIDITASEDVTLLDSSINVTNASLSDFTGSGKSYSAKITPTVDNGEISVVIEPNNIYDIANNYNELSSNEFKWNYDNVNPTITLSSDDVVNDGEVNDSSYITLKITSSENIKELSSSVFSIKNGTISDISGSGSDYTCLLYTSNWKANKNISVSIGSNLIQDMAGNFASSSNTFEFTINKEVTKKLETSEIRSKFVEFKDAGTLTTDELSVFTTTNIDLVIGKSSDIDSNGLSARTELPNFITSNTSRKVFNVLMEQMFENATNKRAKFAKTNIPLKSKVGTLLENVTDLVIANSNQKVEFTDLTTSYTDEAVYIPLSTVNDYIEVELINGSVLRITQSQTDVFSVTKDGTSLGTFDADDDDNDTLTVDNYTIVFGSATMTYEEPNTTSKKYYRCGITGGAVNDTTVNNSAFQTWFEDNDLSWNNSIGLSINIGGSTYRGWKYDEMKTYNDASMTVDEFADYVISFCQEHDDSDRAMLEIAETNPTYDYTFATFRSSSTAAAYLDISYNYNYVLAAADLSNISIHEVTEIVVPTVPEEEEEESGGGTSEESSGNELPYDYDYQFIPCFLEGTKILTSNGYKLIQELVAGEDVLIDDNGKELVCKEVKKFIKKYNGVDFPYVVPKDSKLSEQFICNEDLYLTHNHSIYIPHMNKYIPSSLMKMPQDKTKVDKYVYYHVFTENFFTDVIIANGIPCESHSKYIKQTINNIDSTGKLLTKILNSCNAQGSGMRNRMTNKEFNKIVKQFNKKKGKKNRKK